MKTRKPRTPQARQHAHARAEALGYASIETGSRNPYPIGSYCAVSFDHGRKKAVEARTQNTKSSEPEPSAPDSRTGKQSGSL